MKVDYTLFAKDVKRLKLIVDGIQIDTSQDPYIILDYLSERFGKKVSLYIAHYCCQSTYSDVYIQTISRLKKGETLVSERGHTVHYDSFWNNIKVNKKFRLVFTDELKYTCFEIDLVEMSLKFDIESCLQTQQFKTILTNEIL